MSDQPTREPEEREAARSREWTIWVCPEHGPTTSDTGESGEAGGECSWTDGESGCGYLVEPVVVTPASESKLYRGLLEEATRALEPFAGAYRENQSGTFSKKVVAVTVADRRDPWQVAAEIQDRAHEALKQGREEQ